MLKWLVVFVLACIVFSALLPGLARFGIGRMPGDFRFRLFGREWFLPVTTTVLLSLLASVVAKLI